MNCILFLALVAVFCISSASALECWLCGSGGGSSFKECDSRRTVQNCSEDKFQEQGKGPLNRCAYFSFYSLAKKERIFAKSCTFSSYCTDTGDVFCKNVRDGATNCQVQCCENDKCNADEQFQVVKTWPTPTSDPQSKGTTGMWCNWKESDSDSAACGVVSTMGIIIVACVLSVWTAAVPN